MGDDDRALRRKSESWSLDVAAGLLSTSGQSDDALLARCNEASARYGLQLTKADMRGLSDRRAGALRATGRVEFGDGVLVDVVEGFCSSPFLHQEDLCDILADIQDVFYEKKQKAEEEGSIADDDLIEALRFAFDHGAAGSPEALSDVPVDELRKLVQNSLAGGYDSQTTEDTFDDDGASGIGGAKGRGSAGESIDAAEECYGRNDGIADPLGGSAPGRRPDNEYAAGYYDAFNELYRSGFDANSRIGGSSLG